MIVKVINVMTSTTETFLEQFKNKSPRSQKIALFVETFGVGAYIIAGLYIYI